MTIRMYGLDHSLQIREKIHKSICEDLHSGKLKKKPYLIAICVGSNPSSHTYVRMKKEACEQCNIDSEILFLPEATDTQELLDLISRLNQDDKISGILVQHPLPKHIDTRAVFDQIILEKDVDGVSSLSFGRSCFGVQTFPACTPAGIIDLLDHYQIVLEGAHMVIIGRSPILGRPMAMLGLNRNATVTICHSRSKDLRKHAKLADILIAACGQPRFIQGDWLKPGVVVIDAGYNSGNIGDVDFASCEKQSSYITPVPGGVGPMTIAYLLKHTYLSELYYANTRQLT